VQGERLGDKVSLEQTLHEITGVPIQALRGSPLSLFSVDGRISWATKRQTKREEDAAYSLLGIFNAHMPLIYGEGRQSAIDRLQREITGQQPQQKRNAVSTIPFRRDPDFVDRPDLLNWAHEKCSAPGSRAALVGLGGVG
jgi:hypothetical protein